MFNYIKSKLMPGRNVLADGITTTHRPEFLWSPTRNELVTTKFMRNRLVFATLANELLPGLRKATGRPLNILFWACSTGCEPYTLKFLLGADTEDQITGIDQDAHAIKHAQIAVYNSSTWEEFFGVQKNLLTAAELAEFFDPPVAGGSDKRQVAAKYRKNMRFLRGNLFAARPQVPAGAYDLVVCNNLLLHLKPQSASRAWDYLNRFVAAKGLLLIAGCNPAVRLESAKRLKLQPCPEHLTEISRNWSGVSGAWHFNPRPAWAYPEPDEQDPDYAYLAGEIFRKI